MVRVGGWGGIIRQFFTAAKARGNLTCGSCLYLRAIRSRREETFSFYFSRFYIHSGNH